jgi:hypothetical protein
MFCLGHRMELCRKKGAEIKGGHQHTLAKTSCLVIFCAYIVHTIVISYLCRQTPLDLWTFGKKGQQGRGLSSAQNRQMPRACRPVVVDNEKEKKNGVSKVHLPTYYVCY